MKAENDVLNELIKMATDGEVFYRDASLQVLDPAVADVFVAMAEVRSQLIKDLSNWVANHGGEPAYDGTLLGAMRRLYAEGRAQLAADPDSLYIAQLEEMEDLLLEYYQTALETTQNQAVRRVLQRHLLTVQRAHERMCALKHRRRQKAA